MAYADHVRSSVKPNCWGNSSSYDPHDRECADCRYHHSCNVEINRDRRGAQVSVGTRYDNARTAYRPSNGTDMGEGSTNKPAIIEVGESPVERFAKDAVGGGLRGMFYEMWQFWRHYRIR